VPLTSAGVLMFRTRGEPELLLVHPGGPFWAKKDDGAWSIPKGLYDAGEDPLAAAMREFAEETGAVPRGDFIALGRFVLPSRKSLDVWAVESDFDLSGFSSNLFSMEWPPRSGRQQEFPEIDRAEWFGLGTARSKVVKGQVALLDALEQKLSLR